MKKNLRRLTAMVLTISMVASMIGILPAGAANSDSQIKGYGESDGYDYHTVSANTTYKTVDGDTAVVTDTETYYDDGSNAYVTVAKTIEGTSKENEFDITLQVVTSDDIDLIPTSADAAVVLVFDTSYSMQYVVDGNSTEIASSYKDSRMYAAEEATKTFVENFAASANGAKRMVAVVDFAQYVYDFQSWVDVSSESKLNTVTDFIDDLEVSTLGGTNIDAGLTKANDLVDSLQKSYSDISSVYVVLVTDGAPTYYYNNDTYTNSTPSGNTDASGDDIAYYDPTIVATNAAAQMIRNNDALLYTIAFAEGTNAAYYDGTKSTSKKTTTAIDTWLSGSIASDEDMHYNATNGEELEITLDTIVERIAQLASAWEVTDPMGQYMVLGSDSITGTNNATANTDGTITWKLRNDNPDTNTVNGNETYTYEMSYTVTLNTDASGFAEDTYYLTNGHTYLNYCFVDDATDVTAELATSTASFNVPAVKGEYPDYTYNVKHWLQVTGDDIPTAKELESDDYTQNGEYYYELEDATLNKSAQKYDLIDATANNYKSKYYFLNTAASHKEAVALSVNGQDINFFYDKQPTTATVYHVFYDVVTDNEGTTRVENTDMGWTDTANPVYVSEKYSTTSAAGQGYELVAVYRGDEESGSKLKDDDGAVEITLRLNGTDNVLTYVYEKTDEQRDLYTVNVEHVYTDYAWELSRDGRYELEEAASVTVAGTSTTAYHGTSFSTDMITTKGDTSYTYTEVDVDGASKNEYDVVKTTLTIDEITENTTVTFYYEYKPENTNELTEVTVVHVYQVENSFVDADGTVVKNAISEDGRYTETFNKYYVGESFTATERPSPTVFDDTDFDSAEHAGYTMTTKDRDLTISELVATEVDVETNTVTVYYLRTDNQLKDATVTVIHNYTLYSETIDQETGGVIVEETTGTFEEEFPVDSDELYAGQYFPATAVNLYDENNYPVTGYSNNVNLETLTTKLEAGENVITITYELREELGDAMATVTHTYTTYIRTYVNGAWREIPLAVEYGEAVRYDGAHGETIAIDEVLDFTSDYDETYEDYAQYNEDGVLPGFTGSTSNALEVTLDEKYPSTIDLTYKRVITVLEPTEVTVNHIYTTYVTTVNEKGEVVVETEIDDGTSYTFAYLDEEMEFPLYAGMSFTAELESNDFVPAITNKRTTVLVADGEENVINLYYYAAENELEGATVQVIHHYTTNTVVLGEDDQPETISDETIYKEGVIYGKFAGQYYTANTRALDFDLLTTDESVYTEVLLEAGKNEIHIYYVKLVPETFPATLTVIHDYTTYYTVGNEGHFTVEDGVIDSWSGATLYYYPDTMEESYTVVAVDSDNESLSTKPYTVEMEEGENLITIYYERAVDNRTALKVTVNHTYSTYDENTEALTYDGDTTGTYAVFLEDRAYTADLEEVYLDNLYEYQGDKSELTITLTEDGELEIGIEYLRTIPLEQEDEPTDGGGGTTTTTTYYSLSATYVDEDGNELADEEYTSRIKKGTGYSTEEKAIDGYTFLEMHNGSDAASGIMNSDKEVIYVYAADEVEIPDEDVPLGELPDTEPETTETPVVPELPEIEIPDPEIPLGEIPEIPEVPEVPETPVVPELPEIEIPDPEIPLSEIPDVPQTGDNRNLTLLMGTAILSAVGLVLVAKLELDDKKKRAGN